MTHFRKCRAPVEFYVADTDTLCSTALIGQPDGTLKFFVMDKATPGSAVL